MAYITEDFVSGSGQYKKSLVLQPRDFLVRETGIGGDWQTIRLGVFCMILPVNRVHGSVIRDEIHVSANLNNNINNTFMFGLTTYSNSASLEDFSIISPGRVFLGRMSSLQLPTHGLTLNSNDTATIYTARQTCIGFGENASVSGSIVELSNPSDGIAISGNGYVGLTGGCSSETAPFSAFMCTEMSKVLHGATATIRVSRVDDGGYYRINQARPTVERADTLLQEYLASFPGMGTNFCATTEIQLGVYNYVNPRLNAMFIRWPFYTHVMKIYAYGWYKVN